MLPTSALAASHLGGELFRSNTSEPPRGAAFLVLLAFLGSFALVRISTWGIRENVGPFRRFRKRPADKGIFHCPIPSDAPVINAFRPANFWS